METLWVHLLPFAPFFALYLVAMSAEWSVLAVRPELQFIAGEWNLVYQFYLHTGLIPRLPAWIESWANTPSHHRVHHASSEAYYDHNYGGAWFQFDARARSFATSARMSFA